MVPFQRAVRLLLVSTLVVPTATAFVVPHRSTTQRSNAQQVPPYHPTTSTAFITASSSSTQLQSLPPTLLSDATPISNSLLNFFLESLIANGVPAVFTIGVIAFAAAMFRPKKDQSMDDLLKSTNPVADLYNDLYGDQDQGKNQMLPKFLGNPKQPITLPKNSGVPQKQYITMKHLNRQLDSYKYSLTAATKSKAQAAAQFRQSSFERALGKSVSDLPSSVLQKLQTAEQAFLKQGSKYVAEIQSLQTQLTQHAVDEEMEALGMESVYQLDPPTNKSDVKVTKGDGFRKTDKLQELNKVQREVQQLELDFVKEVIQAVGPTNAAAVRTALLGDIVARGSGGLLLALQERPLTQLFSPDAPKPAMFVTRFPGDASASQVKDLREEVTAIVQSAKPGDEALVILQSGGGTVTGYGLAASQLLRFKEAGLKLTIAVEQVAASGGYMMACVADRIIASPFAVLGSIGVITDIPNVYERLKEEGIEFQTVTAGKFKRTLTPTKKVTKEDFLKTKEDVEDIFVLFRDFVAQHRPQLDIDKVATGETWFGEAALERKLCDDIKAVDDVITDYVDQGYDVFEVDYTPPPETQFEGLGKLLPAGESEGIVGRGIRWFVRTIASELKSELGAGMNRNDSVEKRYMAKDDSADRTKMQG